MSYEEFMRELNSLLVGVPAEEREEALQYYSDYFADAGKENEEQVLKELGGPGKVAALIKAGLKGGMDSGEFTEHGYMDEQFVKKDDLARREPKEEKKEQNQYQYSYGSYAYGGANESYGSGGAYNNGGNVYSNGMGSGMQGNTSNGEKRDPWTSRGLKILLVVLIVIFAFPVIVPVAIAVAATAFGLVCAVFGIFLALVICAGAIMITGFAIALSGLDKLFISPPVAFLAMGFGLVIFVIGLVAVVAAVRLCMIIFPALFRFFVGLCRKPFHRKRV